MRPSLSQHAARLQYVFASSRAERERVYASIAGALAFVVALAFAGRVRPRIDLFLDKCCIHQVDDELKAIYHSRDTVCIWIFKTRMERNRFMDETIGIMKEERENHYETFFRNPSKN